MWIFFRCQEPQKFGSISGNDCITLLFFMAYDVAIKNATLYEFIKHFLLIGTFQTKIFQFFNFLTL